MFSLCAILTAKIQMKKFFSPTLLAWYAQEARELPWRNTGNPYKIWVAEIIMQQTQVSQGTPYFIRFVEKFPNLTSLANCQEDDLLAVWQGLGYYSRALNLKKSAQKIVSQHQGIFPKDHGDILELPGVGPYTAGAISSIAFGQATPAIDGNVKRVIARYLGMDTNVDTAMGYALIDTFLKKEISHENPGDFNQAIMELGASHCSPKNYNCAACPLNMHCIAHKTNTQDDIPIRNKKKKPVNTYINFVVLNCDGKLAIIKRGNDSIWKGLYEFPNIETDIERMDPPDWQALGIRIDSAVLDKVIDIKHQLTHKTIFAKFWVYSAIESNIVLNKKMSMNKPATIGNMAITQLVKKYLIKENFISA
jgi:A/G-specific adenine glycosylase